ncbi:signal transduction histidine kinase, nitrogen specific, NtrB [Rhizobiales bacterium GAS191]|nr:signal transduction histidine kinase, nitrogen specific, NtrB [Rhizobiales bacterium GAS113]SEE22538.1 signal transduction histidine kinase, nitrogen specific, NtrB [Rhizobiales bacterium GAS188]SEE34552.1 signal transduction histidine kinase, nitrogen specific, NtrB [Rhizobiales bacterium GAS191]
MSVLGDPIEPMLVHLAPMLPPEGAQAILNAIPMPILCLSPDNGISYANLAAESFFELSVPFLRRQKLTELFPFDSPVVGLVAEARRRNASVSERRLPITSPFSHDEKIVDIFTLPFNDMDGHVLVMMQERTIADKMDRQLTHRGAARSVSGLAAMLAHEIKNPLSGIRGAAQLLEMSAQEGDRALTQLICQETDRIVKLVDRMEFFGDSRPISREPVNIHSVLDHVKRLARSGFAQHIRIVETYDPSLPPVLANRDQLIQVFLNLVKNAAEAIGKDAIDGEIEFTTAFKPGVKLSVGPSSSRVGLPLEFCVRDNGPGVPADLQPHLFDPFVTTKTQGSGLGLALVAKIIGDHGGIVECESAHRRTTFRVMMPMFKPGM